MITLIFASDVNGIIGNKGKLPWGPLKGELSRFRNTTKFNTIIMGRKTFESLPNGPLGLRVNVVLTRNISLSDYWKSLKYNLFHKKTHLKFTTDINDIINDYDKSPDGEIFIIGGAEIYKQFESTCNRMIWTLVDGEFEGDARFIPSKIDWQKTSEISYDGYKILNFKRKY